MKKDRPYAVVLFYHRVLPARSALGVSCDAFEAHLKFLKSSGYIFMDSSMIPDYFSGNLDSSKKYVLLTFDDGWADNLFFATPLLQKYSARAMVAISSSLSNPSTITRTSSEFVVSDDKSALCAASYGEDFSQFLSWGEFAEMKKSGVWDFASHGSSHFGCYSSLDKIRGFHPEETHWTMKYALGGEIFDGAPRAQFRSVLSSPRTRLSAKLVEVLKNEKDDAQRRKICADFQNPIEIVEAASEFAERIAGDLSSSRKIIAEKLGVTPNCLVWPWGHYSEESEKIASQSGFDFLFTVEKGNLDDNTSKLRIPRIVAPNSLLALKRRMKHGIFEHLSF